MSTDSKNLIIAAIPETEWKKEMVNITVKTADGDVGGFYWKYSCCDSTPLHKIDRNEEPGKGVYLLCDEHYKQWIPAAAPSAPEAPRPKTTVDWKSSITKGEIGVVGKDNRGYVPIRGIPTHPYNCIINGSGLDILDIEWNKEIQNTCVKLEGGGTMGQVGFTGRYFCCASESKHQVHHNGYIYMMCAKHYDEWLETRRQEYSNKLKSRQSFRLGISALFLTLVFPFFMKG